MPALPGLSRNHLVSLATLASALLARARAGIHLQRESHSVQLPPRIRLPLAPHQRNIMANRLIEGRVPTLLLYGALQGRPH